MSDGRKEIDVVEDGGNMRERGNISLTGEMGCLSVQDLLLWG